MAFTREQEKIEAFVGLYECVSHSNGVGRMDIVVDVASGKQEAPFQVLCYF